MIVIGNSKTINISTKTGKLFLHHRISKSSKNGNTLTAQKLENSVRQDNLCIRKKKILKSIQYFQILRDFGF